MEKIELNNKEKKIALEFIRSMKKTAVEELEKQEKELAKLKKRKN